MAAQGGQATPARGVVLAIEGQQVGVGADAVNVQDVAEELVFAADVERCV